MRLIDADALLEAMKDSAEVNVGFISALATHVSLSDVLDLIANAPTVQREGWISVKATKPNKVCLAYYINELGNGRTVKAKYTEQYSEEANTDDDWVEYNESDDTYYYPAGWYEMIDNWDDFTFVTINHEVTHWQPLPEPPTDKE